jgi:hypothetical protein
MTRLRGKGVPIEVTASEEGFPLRFTWRGETHLVGERVNSWRVDDRWWAVHVWREYFKLITDTGLLVIIYHDMNADTWSLQRLYD